MVRRSTSAWRWVVVALLTAALHGCSTERMVFRAGSDVENEAGAELKELLERSSGSADGDIALASYQESVLTTSADAAPFAPDGQQPMEYWELSLDQVVQLALANSSVLRGLGARIIQAPVLTPTIYGPSIQATDPRFGVEAALSAFDAQYATRAFFENNNRVLNNALLGGGTNFFVQDLWRLQAELRKRAATGTEFSVRHNIEDDLNNAPANTFGTAGTIDAHAWSWNIEAELRHPLAQGGGVAFNRIAGTSDTPGITNGVMIARVNTEISAAEFQIALRDFLSNVENAYWELVFAYRNLDVKKTARDRSLETWQALEDRRKKGVRNATEDLVAQAAEQYYRFQQEVEVALGGRLLEGTRNFNGSAGGTFQGVGGVYVAERRLRMIMGLPINDHRLIRPVTEPSKAKVHFQWDFIVKTSITQRTELVQQRLRVKRRELELIASRNFLLPRFDFVGRYRRRGLGDRLYDPVVPGSSGPSVHSGTDEWQLGLELTGPIGFRQAHSAVRNAELTLARDRAVLADMERQVVHDLSNAVSDASLGFDEVKTSWNRRVAAERQFRALEARKDIETDYNRLLDAERRLADAEIAYHRARVRYMLALKNVHVEMGSLMEYLNIHLPERGQLAQSQPEPSGGQRG